MDNYKFWDAGVGINVTPSPSKSHYTTYLTISALIHFPFIVS